MKRYKFLLPVIIVFVALVLVKMSLPVPMDWTPSFSKNDKIPFGSFILFNILTDIFPNQKIETATLPFYNTYKNRKVNNSNIIIICNDFNPDKLDAKIMFDLIEKGNNVFIAAKSFNQIFFDSLKIQTSYSFFYGDSVGVNFTNKNLMSEKDYKFYEGNYQQHFVMFDTSKAIVLGENEFKDANYLLFNIGKGKLFLHTIPIIFTNYNLLKNNREYILKSLSYLPVRNLIWDEYYKEVNKYYSSPMRYILSQPSLKLAYYIALFSVILFVIFQGKRNQRIIPIIKPLTNTTTEFIRTVSNLYYKQKNHKSIAEKKIVYFLDYVRSKYALRTNELNLELINILSEKSLVDKDIISDIFSLIKAINKAIDIQPNTLLELNKLIEKFYSQTGAYGK
jgi:hypothetical protein